MKRRLLIFSVLLFAFASGCFGRRITPEQAQQYARNFWLQKDGPRRALLEPVEIEFPNIYLFVDTGGRGFVLLAADDRSIPVLGYSLENNFVADDMPAAVHDWIQDYNDQIQYLIDNNIEKTSEINAQWQDLNNERSLLPTAWTTFVDKLITTKWGQKSKTSVKDIYNNLCPGTSGNRCLTGCVATAMAQIMKKWNYPSSGVGSNTYTPSGFYYSLSADFENTTYNWDKMPDECGSYSTRVQDTAVATLMYHAGVAVNMDYGTSESGAKTVAANYNQPAAVNAYKKYFKYKWTAHCVYYDDFSDDDWKLLLKAELDAGRPIQYSGSENGGGGHSWVCDGYNGNEQFHMNWGGYGYSDGYFAIGSLNYNSHSYNVSNKAIIGIEPDLSVGNTITITATSNNVAYGTVNGAASYSNTYTKYQDEVTISPAAKEGYRFVGWSSGGKIVSREAPLKFLANGESASYVAEFRPVGGDTLYYCNGGYTTFQGPSNGYQYGAIRIPASSLTSGDKISKIMFYSTKMDYYDIYIYEGSLSSTPTTFPSFRTYSTNTWVTDSLSQQYTIDATQDLFIVVKSPYYMASSMPAANGDAAWGKTDQNSSWTQMQSGGEYLTWMIKAVIAPTVIPHEITINPNAVDLTTLSENVDLRSGGGLGSSNKGADVKYEIVSCNPSGIASMSDDYHITTTGVGTVRIKAKAYDAQSDSAFAEVDLPVNRGLIVWNGSQSTDWNTAENWTPNVIPNNDVNDAKISSGICRIDGDAQCHDLTVEGSSQLFVASYGSLFVSGNLKTSATWHLQLEADMVGSGTVIFGSGYPDVTVNLFLKGTSESDGNDGVKNPQWQLRGSIVDDCCFALNNDNNEWGDIHVYEWNETQNATGCWNNLMVGSAISLKAWKGYGFANYSTQPTFVSYKGALQNKDKTWTLTKTGSGNDNVGNNMLTNGYTAPIDISQLTFDGANSSVIFYNTGSLGEWQHYGGSLSNSGYSPGQMLVCPKMTSDAASMPTFIPAGQSFYVVANQNGATVSMQYSKLTKTASGAMYAPQEQEQFNILGITISGESGADRAVLIECESCTDDYDDGYDGMKYFGNAALPQLYVANTFGNTSINAAESIVGKRLGVHTSQSGQRLTMAFELDRLSNYSQLRLHDLKTGRYADILSGDKYEFVTTDDDESRFEIVGVADDDDQMSEGLRVAGNTLLVGPDEGTVRMFDTSGKLVWQSSSSCGGWVELPEVMHGVYIIKSDNTTIKIVK